MGFRRNPEVLFHLLLYAIPDEEKGEIRELYYWVKGTRVVAMMLRTAGHQMAEMVGWLDENCFLATAEPLYPRRAESPI